MSSLHLDRSYNKEGRFTPTFTNNGYANSVGHTKKERFGARWYDVRVRSLRVRSDNKKNQRMKTPTTTTMMMSRRYRYCDRS